MLKYTYLKKYLKAIPKHYTGRLRYNPVSMLKTVLFGFTTNGHISLRELEDNCKIPIRQIVKQRGWKQPASEEKY